MIRFSSILLLSCLGFSLSGCGAAAVHDSKQLLNLAPGNSPALVGSYDFDVLGDIEGKGCAERGTKTVYYTSITGTGLGSGLGLVAQSEAAAVYDALSKVQGADVLFVTRARSEGDPKDKVCTSVYGKALHLKKGPTVIPSGLTKPNAEPASGGAEAKPAEAAPPAAK